METLPLDLQHQQKNHDHHNKKKQKETLLFLVSNEISLQEIAEKASIMHSSYRPLTLSTHFTLLSQSIHRDSEDAALFSKQFTVPLLSQRPRALYH